MLNRIFIAGFMVVASSSVYSDGISINDLKDLSSGASSTPDLFDAMRSETILQQTDKTYLTYKMDDGVEFPGIMLPNGRVAPAVIRANNDRRPACIDRFYQLHIGRYDPASGKVLCAIRKADLILSEEVDQVSIGNQAVERPADFVEIAAVNVVDPEESNPVIDPTPAEVKQEATKYGANHESNSNSTTSTTKEPASTNRPSTQTAPEPIVTGYRPPLRSVSTNAVHSESLEPDTQNQFGIRKGTWAMVEITRRVSSADHGEIEIRLLEPIRGRYKDLPANTLLFAQKSFNSGTQKLNVQITNALLPDSDNPVRVLAFGYDLAKEAGLSGQIVRDREGEIGSAVGRGTMAAIGSAISSVPTNSNPLVEGVGEATGALINQEQKFVPAAPVPVIEVPRQRFYIQVAQSF